MQVQPPTVEGFRHLDCVIGGDECALISPESVKTKWSAETLHFRSLILRKSDNKVVSCGFKKFFNLNEHPELDVFPQGEFTAVEKRDGSTLILGSHNGELIARTRGSANLLACENRDELEFLKNKYPRLFHAVLHHQTNYSYLLEWESPTNPIVLKNVSEPTLTLIGVIDHFNLTYLEQGAVATIADFLNIPYPKTYRYNSIRECVEDVKGWVGREGVVIYSACGQHLRKIKADEYLRLHALLFGMKSVSNYVSLLVEAGGFTKFSEFFDYISTSLDYEVADRGSKHILAATKAYSTIKGRMNNAHLFLDQIREGFSRKEQAIQISQNYSDWRRGYCFSVLDGKETKKEHLAEIVMAEILKQN